MKEEPSIRPEPDPDTAEDGVNETPDESESGLRRARALETEGRLEEAVQVYRELLSRDPSHLKARNNLGVLQDRMGNHEAALEHFRTALEIEPENPELLGNLGAALGALARFDEAEKVLRRAMRLDPSRVDVRANLGILHFRRGLYAQAESELRWVCERDPEHGMAHFYRGEALNRLGRIDEALESLESASRLQPRNAKIYYVMGILYDRKHLPEEAGAMYRRARELSGDQ